MIIETPAVAIKAPDGTYIISTALSTEDKVRDKAIKIMAWDELVKRGYKIVKVTIIEEEDFP